MCLFPKSFCNLKGVYLQALPPCNFVTGLMQLPMMAAAERYRKLVTDFEAYRSGLRKTQMMRIGWLPSADRTRL